MKPIAVDEMFPEGVDIEDVSQKFLKTLICLHSQFRFYFLERKLGNHAGLGSVREGRSC